MSCPLKRDLISLVLGSVLFFSSNSYNISSGNNLVDPNVSQVNYRSDGGPSSIDLTFFGLTAVAAGYFIRGMMRK